MQGLKQQRERAIAKQQRAIAKQLEKEMAECEKLKAQVGNDDVRSLGSKPPSVRETRTYGRWQLGMMLDATVHCFNVMLK